MSDKGFPEWAKSLPWPAITAASEIFEIDPNLVAAIIQTESAGNPWRIRLEPTYAYLNAPERWAKRLGISKESEVCCQKISFGLMQLMGGTARDMGYEEHLIELVDPTIGIYWGCKYLASRISKYKSVKAAVASYNAGSLRLNKDGEIVNQAYIDRVMTLHAQLN